MSEPKPGRSIAKLVAATLFGFLAAYIGFELIAALGDESGWADVAAILIAIVLIGPGLVLVFATSSPTRYEAAGPSHWPDPADREPAFDLLAHRRRQGAVSIVAGIALVFPVLAPGIMEEGDGLFLYAVLVALVGVETWLNVRVWRDSGEGERRIILGSLAGAFAAFQLLFFLYAAAERMGLAPTITAWTTMVTIMIFYIVANTIATIRVSAAGPTGQ